MPLCAEWEACPRSIICLGQGHECQGPAPKRSFIRPTRSSGGGKFETPPGKSLHQAQERGELLKVSILQLVGWAPREPAASIFFLAFLGL